MSTIEADWIKYTMTTRDSPIPEVRRNYYLTHVAPSSEYLKMLHDSAERLFREILVVRKYRRSFNYSEEEAIEIATRLCRKLTLAEEEYFDTKAWHEIYYGRQMEIHNAEQDFRHTQKKWLSTPMQTEFALPGKQLKIFQSTL